MSQTPIDAVMTWVDGSDPKIIAKQNQYFQRDESDDVTSSSRFANCNEIYYSLSAIFINMPFVNKIYIVTDEQTPPALADIKERFSADQFAKISIVDHKVIFRGYEEYLPTFNSISIEGMLHRIPGLADRYIYFNDDFFVIRPVEEADFFIGNQPVMRGKWRANRSVYYNRWQRRRMLAGKWSYRAKLFSYKECQYNAYQTLGFEDKYFWHDHTPHPFYRPTVEAYYEKHDDILRENIKYRTRNGVQFDPMSLSNGLEIQAGNDHFDEISLTYAKIVARRHQMRYVAKKKRQVANRNSKFLCLQALDAADANAREAAIEWLGRLIFGEK